MVGTTERSRRILQFGRHPVAWAVGAVAVVVAVALLWFGLASNDGGQYAETAAPPSATGDVVPPPEEDVDRASAGTADQPSQDVIPPDEP